MEVTNLAPTDAFEEVEDKYVYQTVSSPFKWCVAFLVVISAFFTFAILFNLLSKETKESFQVSNTRLEEPWECEASGTHFSDDYIIEWGLVYYKALGCPRNTMKNFFFSSNFASIET